MSAEYDEGQSYIYEKQRLFAYLMRSAKKVVYDLDLQRDVAMDPAVKSTIIKILIQSYLGHKKDFSNFLFKITKTFQNDKNQSSIFEDPLLKEIHSMGSNYRQSKKRYKSKRRPSQFNLSIGKIVIDLKD